MSTTERRPLWRVMADAAVSVSRETGPILSRRMFAAEIRALADELVPEEPEHKPLLPSVSMNTLDYGMACQRGQRQKLRALLLAEAERAEDGR